MKLVNTSLTFLVVFALSVPVVFAEEFTETPPDIPPDMVEEVVPEEEIVPEETEEGSENMFMFSEPSSVSEASCWQDENKNTWCTYSDGTTGIKQSNPFFTQLATYNETSNFLSVTASLNGTTIQTNGPNYIPLNQDVLLNISFSRSREGETYAPYQGIPLVFDDVVGNAGSPSTGRGTAFVFYKGEIGKSAWITETYTPYGGIVGNERSISFSEPGHYFLVAVPIYSPGKQVPGLEFDQFNYNRFLQFLSTGIDQEGNTPGSGIIDPLLYGVLEFDVLDVSEAPKVSNILFLPGIKGSKLWMAANGCDFFFFDCEEEPLWPPAGHRDIQDLFLTDEGKSFNQVYTKKNEVLDTYFGIDFYKSFLESLSSLKNNGTINDFEAVPYDWRLSLDDIVLKGTEREGKLFYEEATSTPYIEQELRKLAATSQTGKVTVVTHSNGGLVAKRLFAEMGDTETSELVDALIMVGAPQSGAPQAIGALLFGYGEALPYDFCSQELFFGYFCSLFSSRDLARTLAENSPMAYQLLPSFSYFESIDNAQNPVARFSGLHAYAQDFALYGETIENWNELSRFLRADEATRIKPSANDIIHPNVLSSPLLNYAEDVHRYRLDYWAPPKGVNVYQLAGWGVDTISGIEFVEQATPYLEYLPLYRPIFVEDGDGVVPIPSALMIPTSEHVKNYWLDLTEVEEETSEDKKHADLFSINSVRGLIQNVLNKNNSLPPFISTEQPPAINESKKLRFLLHAEAALLIEDELGTTPGYQEVGAMDTSSQDSSYDEFGGVKIITISENKTTYKVSIKATTTPEKITLDIEQVEAGKTKKRSTVTNVPITSSEILSFTIEDETGSTTPIVLESEIEPLPIVSFEDGGTVIYGVSTSSPTEIPEEEESSGGSNGGVSATSTPSSGGLVYSNSSKKNTSNKQNIYFGEVGTTTQSTPTVIETIQTKNDASPAEVNSLEKNTTQTASVYDAFVNMSSWLKEVLYTILRFSFSFFHISFAL